MAAVEAIERVEEKLLDESDGSGNGEVPSDSASPVEDGIVENSGAFAAHRKDAAGIIPTEARAPEGESGAPPNEAADPVPESDRADSEERGDSRDESSNSTSTPTSSTTPAPPQDFSSAPSSAPSSSSSRGGAAAPEQSAVHPKNGGETLEPEDIRPGVFPFLDVYEDLNMPSADEERRVHLYFELRKEVVGR